MAQIDQAEVEAELALPVVEETLSEVDNNRKLIEDPNQTQNKTLETNTSEQTQNNILESTTSKLNTLTHKKEFWSKVITDKFVISVIINGIKVKFQPGRKKVADSMCQFNQISHNAFSKHSESVRSEINSLLNMGVIYEYLGTGKSYFSNIFLVFRDSSTSPTRPIINLKKFNKNVVKEKFKMIGWKDVVSMLSPSSFVTSIDISKAFFHIPININDQKYFAFSFENKTYRYERMPFGYKLAPYIFNRIMGACLAYIRELLECTILHYLDDILIINDSYEESVNQSKRIVEELKKFGWSVNVKKSNLIPANKFDYLGINFDVINQSVFPSINNFKSIGEKALKFINSKEGSLRQLESLVGSANFISQFIFEGRFHLHPIINNMLKNFKFQQRDLVKHLDQEMLEALQIWTSPSNFNRRNFPLCIKEITLATDASLTGWGAILQIDNSIRSTQGAWSIAERRFHINQLELLAVQRGLDHFYPDLKNSQVHILSDNITTIATLKRMGSHKFMTRLQIAKEILDLLLKHNIHISLSHIRGKDNILADDLSRSAQTIPTEMELSERVVKFILNKFALYPEVDLFANQLNHKFPIFFTAVPMQKDESFNAFSQDWSRYSCLYAFPPPQLIPRVLYKWKLEKRGHLILIAPAWKKSFWLPKLQKMASKILLLPLDQEDTFLREKQGINYLSNKNFNLHAYLL